jgi:hypothetical protein
VAMVDLSWGGRRQLRDRDFRPIAREELVARGGRIELHPWRIEPRVGVEFAPTGAEDVALRAGAALSYAHGSLEYEVEVAFVAGDVTTRGFDGSERSITGGPSISWRNLWGRLIAAKVPDGCQIEPGGPVPQCSGVEIMCSPDGLQYTWKLCVAMSPLCGPPECDSDTVQRPSWPPPTGWPCP